MFDILHKVGIRSSTQDVYRALTTLPGLAGWWTNDTRGRPDLGGVIEFHFGTRGYFKTKVLVLEPAKRVVWQVVEGPEEWVGSTISFDLNQDGDEATVFFKHQGWKAQSEFMHHCSTKWATFLMSLKALAETGTGAPFPDDIRISVNWD